MCVFLSLNLAAALLLIRIAQVVLSNLPSDTAAAGLVSGIWSFGGTGVAIECRAPGQIILATSDVTAVFPDDLPALVPQFVGAFLIADDRPVVAKPRDLDHGINCALESAKLIRQNAPGRKMADAPIAIEKIGAIAAMNGKISEPMRWPPSHKWWSLMDCLDCFLREHF